MNAPVNGYVMVGDYIQYNSNADEVIWADSSAADKMAWLTGRKVANGKYGAPENFVEQHQRINIYTINNTFHINNRKMKQ